MEYPAEPPVDSPVSEGHAEGGEEFETPVLKELFPGDDRDLDELFPEAEIRQLFRDVVGGLASVDRFIQRTHKQLEGEQSPEPVMAVADVPSFRT